MVKNNIKQIRLAREMSMAELASRAKTTQPMISCLESGERKLTLEWMEKLSVALGCAPWQLLPMEWQPGAANYDDDDRFIRIWNSINIALRMVKKNAPDEAKLRLALYLFREGYARGTDAAANDNEISRAVKLVMHKQ